MKRRSMLPVLTGAAISGILVLSATGGVFAQEKRTPAETAAHGSKVSKPLFGMNWGGKEKEASKSVTTGERTTAPPRSGMTGKLTHSQVMELQRALNQNGAGLQVDGVMGKKTRNAIMNYQARNSLAVSGHLDSDTRAQLGM